MKFDQSVSYFDDKYGGYTRSGSDLGPDPYGKRPESRYDIGRNDGYGDGVYAYEGGKVEPYGARGTAPKSSTWAGFDDYGRAINFPSGKDSSVGSGSVKIVRAVPKAETQQDVKSGVQKFRVKLLAESGGQSTMDVLCQVPHFPFVCARCYAFIHINIRILLIYIVKIGHHCQHQLIFFIFTHSHEVNVGET